MLIGSIITISSFSCSVAVLLLLTCLKCFCFLQHVHVVVNVVVKKVTVIVVDECESLEGFEESVIMVCSQKSMRDTWRERKRVKKREK